MADVVIEPGHCERCGHKLKLHTGAGVCTFSCDCYQPGEICGCGVPNAPKPPAQPPAP